MAGQNTGGAYDRRMFRNLLTRLFEEDQPADRHLGAEDGEIAIAALLIRVARADDRYTAVEQHLVDAILAARRRLDAAEIAGRRAAAEMIEAEGPDTARLTRSIRERIALEDRMDVLAALWEVALADGRQSPQEEATVRLAAGLLGINEVDTANARRMIMARLAPDSS